MRETSMAAPTAESRSLAFDIGFTILLIAGLVAGFRALNQFTTGATEQVVSQRLHDVWGLFIGPLLVLSILEHITRPAGPRKSLSSSLLNVRISVFYFIAETFAAVLAVTSTAALARHFHLGFIDLRFASGRGAIGLAGAVLLSMMLGDFLYYWWHRFSHRPILWQAHKLHHMDPELDVVTNMRDNWVCALTTIIFQNIPLTILFKLDATQAITAGGILGIVIGSYSSFFHANLRVQFGIASGILVSPQWHRIHHSRLPEHKDRNFAGLFPIWDIMFGTNHHPAHDEFPPTGVDGEKEVQSARETIVFTFRAWQKMYREWRSRRSVFPV